MVKKKQRRKIWGEICPLNIKTFLVFVVRVKELCHMICDTQFVTLVLLQQFGGHVIDGVLATEIASNIILSRQSRPAEFYLIILPFVQPYKHGIQLCPNGLNKNAGSMTKDCSKYKIINKCTCFEFVLKAFNFVSLCISVPYRR
jgi:hypothetical protein